MDNTTLTRRDETCSATIRRSPQSMLLTKHAAPRKKTESKGWPFSKLDIIVVEMIHSTKRSNTIACSDGPHSEVINQS